MTLKNSSLGESVHKIESFTGGDSTNLMAATDGKPQKVVIEVVEKKPLTEEEVTRLLIKYQPGKVTALPPMMTHQAS